MGVMQGVPLNPTLFGLHGLEDYLTLLMLMLPNLDGSYGATLAVS